MGVIDKDIFSKTTANILFPCDDKSKNIVEAGILMGEFRRRVIELGYEIISDSFISNSFNQCYIIFKFQDFHFHVTIENNSMTSWKLCNIEKINLPRSFYSATWTTSNFNTLANWLETIHTAEYQWVIDVYNDVKDSYKRNRIDSLNIHQGIPRLIGSIDFNNL